MEIKPIKTDADYRMALTEVEKLMTAELNTPEGENLDVLVHGASGGCWRQYTVGLAPPAAVEWTVTVPPEFGADSCVCQNLPPAGTRTSSSGALARTISRTSI